MRKLIIGSLLVLISHVGLAVNDRTVFKSAQDESQRDSFNTVKDYVYQSPRPGFNSIGQTLKLPQHNGVTIHDVAKLLGSLIQRGNRSDLSNNWELAADSRRTLSNSSNFKPQKVKLLHPRGVCVAAEWSIHTSTPATGLFSKGTKVPAILRLSSGTGTSERIDENGKKNARMFGIALKLFHQDINSNLDSPAMTSNIFTLDQDGFDAVARPYFSQLPGYREVHFTNVVPTNGFFGKLLNVGLKIFDRPSMARPVYVTSHFDSNGQKVSQAQTPYEVRFYPRFKKTSKLYPDFRHELLDTPMNDWYFDIVLMQMYQGQKMNKVIGQIKPLDNFVLTDNCDLGLTFHHSPNQWKDEYTPPILGTQN